MNSKNKVIITYGLWLMDILTIAGSFILATYIRFGNFVDMGDRQSHFLAGLICLFIATIYAFMIPWNSGIMKRKPIGELWEIIKVNAVIILTVLVPVFFFQWAKYFSRLVMLYFGIINVILMFVLHMIFKKVMKAYYKSDLVKTKVIVITQSELKDEVNERLKHSLDPSFQVIDTITVDDVDELFYEQMTQQAVDEVFVYAPDWQVSKVNRLMRFFYEMGVRCDYCIEIPEMDWGRSYIGKFADYSVFTYTHFQSSYKRLLIKRLMDIVGGLIGCIITILFTPFVAIAIKLNSKGPVFFSQERIGRNGRRFKMTKFRSMYMDAEERKKELEDQNEVEGLMFKIKDDPRITKVGKFLRKTSIDELPQFFSIVKGDMSLVGTRPPTVDEFEKYDGYYRRRLSMTPGLTGLWQVSGRSDVDNFDDVVKYDLEYIDHWSLGLDIKILFKTIAVVFVGRGSR
ncbi:MAG: sugar transferase [Lachnospiraceae bacterium]|nr:sugar transferase [Lachnospiraceae bacterium]